MHLEIIPKFLYEKFVRKGLFERLRRSGGKYKNLILRKPEKPNQTLWCNSPLAGQGSLSMRFLDHAAGAPWASDHLAAGWPSHSLPQNF
jgi:hypothetical protein